MTTVLLQRLPPEGPLADVGPQWIQVYERYFATFRGERYTVVLTRENIGTEVIADWRWHVSVAGPEDVPSWQALSAIGHRVRPGVGFVSALPPEVHWINVHPRVLHLFEINDPSLEAQWAREGRGDVRT